MRQFLITRLIFYVISLVSSLQIRWRLSSISHSYLYFNHKRISSFLSQLSIELIRTSEIYLQNLLCWPCIVCLHLQAVSLNIFTIFFFFLCIQPMIQTSKSCPIHSFRCQFLITSQNFLSDTSCSKAIKLRNSFLHKPSLFVL